MSLYNQLFGVNKLSPYLLKMIDKDIQDFGRFRDVFLSEDGTKILVYTRNGGGNRAEYGEYLEWVGDCNYLRNYDDEFDNTYAYVEFKVPEKYEACTRVLVELQKVPSPVGEQFKEFVELMETVDE